MTANVIRTERMSYNSVLSVFKYRAHLTTGKVVYLTTGNDVTGTCNIKNNRNDSMCNRSSYFIKKRNSILLKVVFSRLRWVRKPVLPTSIFMMKYEGKAFY